MIHLEEVALTTGDLTCMFAMIRRTSQRIQLRCWQERMPTGIPGSRALIIYNEDIPIGMALYYYIDGAYDFSQFFIDERYQGNGFGYEAAGHVLREMQKDGVYNRVILCYIEGNEAAKQLYLKYGFDHTGETDGNEIIMEKKLR